MVLIFWDFMVNAGDYVTIEVVKTIALRKLTFFFDDIMKPLIMKPLMR